MKPKPRSAFHIFKLPTAIPFYFPFAFILRDGARFLLSEIPNRIAILRMACGDRFMSFAISSADLERFASSSKCRYSFQEQPPFFLFRAIKKLGLSRLRLQPELDQAALIQKILARDNGVHGSFQPMSDQMLGHSRIEQRQKLFVLCGRPRSSGWARS